LSDFWAGCMINAMMPELAVIGDRAATIRAADRYLQAIEIR
jgi:hypothetical protein